MSLESNPSHARASWPAVDRAGEWLCREPRFGAKTNPSWTPRDGNRTDPAVERGFHPSQTADAPASGQARDRQVGSQGRQGETSDLAYSGPKQASLHPKQAIFGGQIGKSGCLLGNRGDKGAPWAADGRRAPKPRPPDDRATWGHTGARVATGGSRRGRLLIGREDLEVYVARLRGGQAAPRRTLRIDVDNLLAKVRGNGGRRASPAFHK